MPEKYYIRINTKRNITSPSLARIHSIVFIFYSFLDCCCHVSLQCRSSSKQLQQRMRNSVFIFLAFCRRKSGISGSFFHNVLYRYTATINGALHCVAFSNKNNNNFFSSLFLFYILLCQNPIYIYP